MSHLIDIRDGSEKFLEVRLLDILTIVSKEGSLLNWVLLDVWAMGKLSGGRTYLELEEEVRQAPLGLSLSWKALLKLANAFEDVYEIYLVGHSAGVQFARSEKDDFIYSKAAMVVELFDSSYWRVYSENELVIDRLQAAFKDTVIQDHLLTQPSGDPQSGPE